MRVFWIFMPFPHVLDPKELPVSSEPRHCCCRWSERMIMTQSARKSGVKLYVVEELGLGLPKQGSKSALFFDRAQKMQKSGKMVLWNFSISCAVSDFFCVDSWNMMCWGPFLPQPDLQSQERRDITKWIEPLEIYFCFFQWIKYKTSWLNYYLL